MIRIGWHRMASIGKSHEPISLGWGGLAVRPFGGSLGCGPSPRRRRMPFLPSSLGCGPDAIWRPLPGSRGHGLGAGGGDGGLCGPRHALIEKRGERLWPSSLGWTGFGGRGRPGVDEAGMQGSAALMTRKVTVEVR